MDLEKEARRLRELFGGRFSQDEARQLLSIYGENAALCVIQAESSEISRILGQANNNVRFTQEEYERASRLLEEGLEQDSEPRQFACRQCEKCWWKRVPGRKKVSKCLRCKQKYDPIPRDKEWGTGVFECHFCEYEFRAAAIMGVTECVCHKCNHTVPVTRITPPRRQEDLPPRKNNHDCNGVNCYQWHICPPQCQDCPNAEHDIGLGRRRPSNYSRLQDFVEMELRINRLPNNNYRNRRRRNFRRGNGSPSSGRGPGRPDDDSQSNGALFRDQGDHSQNHGVLFGDQGHHSHNHGALFLDRDNQGDRSQTHGALFCDHDELDAQSTGKHCHGGPLIEEGTKSATSALEEGPGQIDVNFGSEALEIKMQVLRLQVSDSLQDEGCNSSTDNSELQENEPEKNGTRKKKRHRKKNQRKQAQENKAVNKDLENIGKEASQQINHDIDDVRSETISSQINGEGYFSDDDPPNPGLEDQQKTPICYHKFSVPLLPPNVVVRTWSERHISSGSTVTTCLDQISLMTQSVRLAYKMDDED